MKKLPKKPSHEGVVLGDFPFQTGDVQAIFFMSIFQEEKNPTKNQQKINSLHPKNYLKTQRFSKTNSAPLGTG